MAHIGHSGIGARDDDLVTVSIYGVPCETRVGWVYAEARREANWERRKAFYALPDFPDNGAHTFHPVDPTTRRERERGIPAW